MKPKVYFSREISGKAALDLCKILASRLSGRVAVKVHSGEVGNQNFLRPEFWAPILSHVGGTVCECNTAYEGQRNETKKHLAAIKLHGWTQFPVDLLDAEGPDLVLEIPEGKRIQKNYVGKNLEKYDSLLVLSHFKGHPMGGYGGALKQLSIGIACSYGKAYIHGAGEPAKIWTADHDSFLESMADAAKSIIDRFEGRAVYINVMKNMSVDCDCCAVAEDPCMKDIGILVSDDPVAIDQACIDLVYAAKEDPGQGHLLERIESRNGVHTIEAAAELGCGSREYELIEVGKRPDYDLTKRLLRNTVPALAYDGSDLSAWQSKAREKLCQLLGLDRFERVSPDVEIEYTRPIDGGREIRFTYQSEAGYRVPAHLWIPDGVEKPPLMICLQGHSKGMHISLGRPKFEGDEETMSGGDRDFCVRALKEGYAAVALEQRHFGECGGTPRGPACNEPSLTALLFGRTAVGERVWDVMRLIDVLTEEFSTYFDTRRIGCMGNSGGGTTTAYLAALEDRLALAMPSSALSTYAASIGAMAHCTCNYVPHIAEFFDMGDLIAMAAPKAYVQVNGREDPIFPLEGAREVFAAGQKAYKAAGAENKLTLVIGEGAHRFYADDAWPAVHKLMEFLKG